MSDLELLQLSISGLEAAPRHTRPETAGVACHGGLEGLWGDGVVVVVD